MNKLLTFIFYLYLYYELNINYIKSGVCQNMDKNNIIREKTFNRNEYNREYNARNYKKFGVNISIPLYEQIENYCKDNGMTKADFLRLAIDVIINKSVDIS